MKSLLFFFTYIFYVIIAGMPFVRSALICYFDRCNYLDGAKFELSSFYK